MAYEFQRQKVASFQLDSYLAGSGNKMTFKGVNGAVSSAYIIVGGVQQLLSIVGLVELYDPTDAKRTVDERVTNNQ